MVDFYLTFVTDSSLFIADNLPIVYKYAPFDGLGSFWIIEFLIFSIIQ